MNTFFPSAAVLGMALTLPALAADKAGPRPLDQGSVMKTVTVEIKGQISRGTAEDDWGEDDRGRPRFRLREAWYVAAGGVSYELIFQGEKRLHDAADKLDGKTAIVTGRLETRYRLVRLGAGSERGATHMVMSYPVVVVDSLKADESAYVRKTTTVRLTGKLELDLTEIKRPYGVSWYVAAQGRHYYLHFGKNVGLEEAARRFSGQKVLVTGTEELAGFGPWLIVHVESMAVADAKGQGD
jgi:hypothetical protein